MRCLAFTSYPVISFLCCDRSRLRSGPKGTGWLDLRYSGMPGSRSLFFLGDKRRQWRFMAPSATAAAFHCRAGRGGCRRSGRIARSPPSGGRDAANNSCLPCRAGRGGRRRSGRTARPPPSGGQGAAIFLSPPLARPFFFLDVDRPFLPSVAHSSLR